MGWFLGHIIGGIVLLSALSGCVHEPSVAVPVAGEPRFVDVVRGGPAGDGFVDVFEGPWENRAVSDVLAKDVSEVEERVEIAEEPRAADGDILDCGEAPSCEGPGVCVSGGEASCLPSGKWVCDYSETEGFQEGQETWCDGLDNDCDGLVDEDMGLGAACDGPDADGCPRGVFVCDEALKKTVCDEGPDTVSAEICDGLDNDCDGDVDEGFEGLHEPCDLDGDGCATGLFSCVDGSVACVGDTSCGSLNPMCVAGEKPLEPDYCACAPDLFCDGDTATACVNGKCQCGFLGAPCQPGFLCNFGTCVPGP